VLDGFIDRDAVRDGGSACTRDTLTGARCGPIERGNPPFFDLTEV
jgi:hypothetical protein